MENDGNMITRAEVTSEIRELRTRIGLFPLAQVVRHWLEIAITMAFAACVNNPWIWACAVVIIGIRQYAMLVLLHDGQHGLLYKTRKGNDFIARWLIAAPCGTPFSKTRSTHLAHHTHLGDRERDPDYSTYCAGPPSPKRSSIDLFLYLAKRIGGAKLLALLRSNRVPATELPVNRAPGSFDEMVPIVVMQVLLIGLLWFSVGWWCYFIAWLLPLAIVVVPLNDFRLFCEHSLAQIPDDHKNSDELMITYISNPLERLFVAPNNMNFHAEHHLFPVVPCRHLPRVRRLISGCPELSGAITVRHSYLGHLLEYLKVKSSARTLHL